MSVHRLSFDISHLVTKNSLASSQDRWADHYELRCSTGICVTGDSGSIIGADPVVYQADIAKGSYTVSQFPSRVLTRNIFVYLPHPSLSLF